MADYHIITYASYKHLYECEKIDGYDNANINDESDFVAFEEKMRQAKVS